ncbi:MAG TPA: IS3 family transposase [Ilumatobacteraceae bacterium]|nr:IS3 family transposase [Sedimentisphaerales bacterium]HPM52708.1 IS3 family transposase [Rhodoglobus sp.]HQZ37324.1 IS3 family transposase [Ilumatobacteraceae bacterium]
MPKAFPREFREDVVAIARRREVAFAQIAKDFGISETTVQNWVSRAEIDDGVKPGVTSSEATELREARKRIRLLEMENEVLRRAAAYLSQGSPPKMIYPLVRELAATGAPIRVPVAVTCRVLKIAKQPFYRWLKAPVSTRDWDDAQLTNAAIDAHEEAPTFGYRLIADELTDLGFEVSERRVWRLCSQQGIVSATTRKKRGKAGKQGPPVHDDLVQRQFTAAGPNQLWLTDITEHWTGEGKLYLCAIKDVFSNRIVGYSIDDRMTADLAVNALRMAIQRRRPVGTTVHSDRGSQFRSRRFVLALSRAGLVGSMGRVGAAGDNAAMESFFALLQKNVLDQRSWVTRQQLRLAIVTWIEATYHRRRRQRALGRLTPIEFETIMTTPAATAA